MRQTLYFLIFATFLITSCKEDEAPQSYLNGTYENVGTNTETGISYVSQYTFHSDGSLERISLLKQGEELLGYTYYSKGTYTLSEKDFRERQTQSARVNYEEFPEGYTKTLDELEAYEVSENPTEFKGTLRQIDGGNKIGILMECNDVIGYSSMCMGEQIYVKVD